ncbi:MAG: hypothetical protein PF436_03430 [Prolixibacteraceae bacterium]|jgi:hypothetical protein|nr:hypothetical protein [Prolixibacteraceae bacterium]
MKKIYTLTITLFIAINCMAQTTLEFNSAMFDNLTTSKLSTTILADKAGLPELLFGFNGSSSCAASGMEEFLYAYQTLYAGNIGTPTIPTPDAIFNSVGEKPTDVIPLGALYFNYNYIDENALNNGLIQIINSQFFDGPNSGNPYNQSVCVALGTLYPDTLTQLVTFKAEPIRGNLSNNVSSAQINFADGAGYRTYTANTQYGINYSTDGDYTITLKLNLTGGGSVYAKSLIHVSASAPLKSVAIGGFPSDYPCNNGIVPAYNNTISITRTGSMNDGLVKIWYGNNPNGTPKTQLTKPVVIVDGFDPIPLESVDRSAEEIYFETNFSDTYPNSCTEDILNEDRMDISEGLIDRLKNLGYDICIVDFEWGGNDIMENVATLKLAIGQINTRLSNNGSSEKLIVMGPSMGALISRIAISEMTNHNTRIYISFDGPQQGAYIPMPLQELYSYMFGVINKTITISEAVFALLNMPMKTFSAMLFQVTLNGVVREYSPLDCPAAKQMLMYHYLGTSNDQPFAPHSDHTTLYNSIAGVYPSNCMNVAISCGDGHGNSQLGFPSAGTDYLGYSTSSKIKTDIEFKELPTSGSLSPFMKLNVWQNALFGIRLNYINKEYKSYTTSSSKSYEQLPGGNFNGNYMLGSILDNLSTGFDYDKYECFMPLSTALDLSSGVSSNIFSEFSIPSGRNFTKNIYPSKSPFDMLYVCNENKYHVLRGPNPNVDDNTLNSSIPGLTQDMADFVVFLVENSENIEGATQSEVYNMYDIFLNNGIQYCSQPFNVNLLENGTVKKSYNSSAVTLSNATLSGNDIDVELYSTQGITIGENTTIDIGASFYFDYSECPSE